MDRAASLNNFTHYRKLISLADGDWEIAEAGKIAALDVEIRSANRMVDQYGREFEAARANRLAIEMANHGFLTSAVFFPVVAQHHAAIRITLRADMEPSVIQQFCELANELINFS